MQHLGNKLIEINVTDSSLIAGVPDTGANSGLFSIVIDRLTSTPLAVILLSCLSVAFLMCFIAIILSRVHHNKEKSSKLSKISRVLSKTTIALSPIVVALTIIVTSTLNIFAVVEGSNSLNSTPISITIDKAKALSASDETTITLDNDASSHVDIFAKLDTTLDNNLGTNLTISTNHINDSGSIVNLSTTDTLIYTTSSPVTAGDTEGFNVIVDITKDLPIGTYKGYIDFFGEYVQSELITVTYWCDAVWDIDLNELDDDILVKIDEGVFIGKNVLYDLGETFTLSWPSELGLNECNNGDSIGRAWRNLEKYNDDRSYYYWVNNVSKGVPSENDLATVVLEFPSQFTGSQPDASTENWYDECWLDYAFHGIFCNNNDFNNWLYDIYFPWRAQYERDWIDWGSDFRDENGSTPIFNGMEFKWGGNI